MKERLKSMLGALLAMLLILALSLIYLALRLGAVIMGRLKIGSILSVGKFIKTPVVSLYNPRSNRKVVLIGMMHIGDEAYYQKVQAVITSLQECAVLYECVGKLSVQERKQLTKPERKILERFESMQKSRGLLKMILGLDDQLKGLTYDDPTWIRTDMSMLDLIRRLDRSGYRPPAPSKENKKNDLKKLLDGSDESQTFIARWFFGCILAIIPLLVATSSITSLFNGRSRRMTQVILHDRSTIAVEAIVDHSQHKDIVSIWGSAHLPGMIRLLRKEGFKETGREWLTVCERMTLFSLLTFLGVEKESVTSKT